MEEIKKKTVVLMTTKKKVPPKQVETVKLPVSAPSVQQGKEPPVFCGERDWHGGCIKWRDTILLMLSRNTADNLKAEYWQTKFRIQRLQNEIKVLESGLIPIDDDIKEAIYEHYSMLNKTLIAIEKRLKVENIDYMYIKPTPGHGVPIYQENYGKGRRQKFNRVQVYVSFTHCTKDEARKRLFGDKTKENKGEDKNGKQSTADGKVQTKNIRRPNRQGTSGGNREKNDSERGNKSPVVARDARNRKDDVRKSDSE